MDNYENRELHNEPVPQEPEVPASQEPEIPASQEPEIPVPQEPVTEQVRQEPVSQPYYNMGVGRKESPFADSPYEMPYRPEEPISPPPKKAKAKK